jgi:hypothetical protein
MNIKSARNKQYFHTVNTNLIIIIIIIIIMIIIIIINN